MPELPEIIVKAKQMDAKLKCKRIYSVESKQPKNLNVPFEQFSNIVRKKTIVSVSARGKWLVIKLDPAYRLLINLGMNGDVIYFDDKTKPLEKYHFKLTFGDGTGFAVLFQWIGLVHLVSEAQLPEHKLTASLAMSPLDKGFTLEYFKQLIRGRRGRIKSFLLDQKNVAGIGNVYVQDVLFCAKLHPDRSISSFTEKEISSLYKSIGKVLEKSIKLGGLAYEKDFYGKSGRLTGDKFLVGYKPGKPCPECGTIIQKIRTGTTSSYICPKCQTLPHSSQ